MNLKPPSDLKWRLIKLRLNEKDWLNIRCTTKKELDKVINQYNPIEVYYSVSKYLNPLKIENPSYYVDTIILATEDIYDIDSDDLYKAWETTKEIIKIKGRPKEIHFTGAKGYRLIYGCYSKINMLQKRKYIENYLNFEEIDINVSTDIFRVIRMIGSPNIKTGLICEEINNPERYVPPHISMTQLATPLGIKGISRPGLRHTSFYISLSNKIRDDCYVLYLITKHKPNMKKLSLIQHIYRLPHMYVFKTTDYYVTICLKVLSKQRLIKILKACNNSKYRQIEKFNSGRLSKLYIRTSSEITESNIELRKKPLLYAILESKFIYRYQSWQHYDFVSKFTYVPQMTIQIKPNQNPLSIFKVSREAECS